MYGQGAICIQWDGEARLAYKRTGIIFFFLFFSPTELCRWKQNSKPFGNLQKMYFLHIQHIQFSPVFCFSHPATMYLSFTTAVSLPVQWRKLRSVECHFIDQDFYFLN